MNEDSGPETIEGLRQLLDQRRAGEIISGDEFDRRLARMLEVKRKQGRQPSSKTSG